MKKKTWLVNFEMKEFACPCGCDRGSPSMSDEILFAVQLIRSYYDAPVVITSGHRCKKYNKTLKNSISNSDHIKDPCKAVDFKVTGKCDTSAKRLEIMRFCTRIPGFKYAYCNGYYITKTSLKAYSAPLMGNAIHLSME